MNKQFLLLFMLVIMLTTVSADFLGTFRINEEMQITNYCRSGVCTFVILDSLEYPNGTIIYPDANMTKNGQSYNYSFTPVDLGTYVFTTCGDSTVEVCDKDNFFVNFNGEDNSISTMIILLLFFISLFIGYYYLNSKINYERWYDSIYKKFEHKNYIKLVFAAVAFNLTRNQFANYYFLGFPVVLIITDLIMTYNINILFQLFQYVIAIYTLGIILVAISFFGQWQELIVRLKDDVLKQSWGIGN